MSFADESYKKNMHNDLLQSTVGNFGKWQFKISMLMALLKFPIAWFQLSIVFLAPPTQFWCKAPPEVNYTSIGWYNFAKPTSPDYLYHEGLNTGFCHMNSLINRNETIPCVYGYEYNKTVFKSSIVTEWDLICGHKRLVDLTQITLMLGVLIGNVFFGIFADRQGRKRTLMICIFLQSIFGIIASWVPWFWTFILARFILAIANGGTMVASFVMCMEVVGGKWRTIVPILYQIPFGFGNTIMAVIAFYLRDWRYFHFTISVLSSLYAVYLWFIPESPRWLMATGKKEEAMVVLQSAAKQNGISPEKVQSVLTDLSNVSEQVTSKPSFGSLFSTKALKKRTILLCINWLICGITFYAFSQYLGKVSRNMFLTVATSGFIALPGTIFCVYIIARTGRRWTIASAHLVTSVCFLAILAVPEGHFAQDWPRILFAGIGIIGLSVSMPALYLFTGELFPTVVRVAGVGAAVMFSRLGSMIAPLVISLHDISSFLPLLLLGIIAFLEALLVLPLPETKGTALPETIDDLEDKKNQKYVLVPLKPIEVL